MWVPTKAAVASVRLTVGVTSGRKRAAARLPAGGGSGRAARSGGCAATGGRRRSRRPSTPVASSSGSPSQTTTSARRPGRSEPISSPRPTASAGAELIAAKAWLQLRPVAPGIRVKATRLPAYWVSSRTCRASSSLIMPIETLTPAARIRPMLDWVAASCSKAAGRSLSALAMTGTCAAAICWATRQPSLAPTRTRRKRREFALQRQHLEDVAGPLDMDEQQLPPAHHRARARRHRSG